MAAAAGSSIYLPESVTLLGVEQPTELEKVFRVKFDSGRPLGHGPGQFVQVSLFGIGEAPISICSSPCETDYFEMTVRNVGMLTNAMHKLTPGAKFGVRGPFGTTFPIDEMEGKDLILVAGGIGKALLDKRRASAQREAIEALEREEFDEAEGHPS